MTDADPQTGYAPVNGLEMYYEVHGAGRPLVVLHGAYMTIGTMGEVVPGLADQLAVLPGTTHFVPPGFAVLDRADWLVSMIGEFLDAPMLEVDETAGDRS